MEAGELRGVDIPVLSPLSRGGRGICVQRWSGCVGAVALLLHLSGKRCQGNLDSDCRLASLQRN